MRQLQALRISLIRPPHAVASFRVAHGSGFAVYTRLSDGSHTARMATDSEIQNLPLAPPPDGPVTWSPGTHASDDSHSAHFRQRLPRLARVAVAHVDALAGQKYPAFLATPRKSARNRFTPDASGGI